MKVLVIPSWFPSAEHPTAGIFVYQQVAAVRNECDAAVLYVREAAAGQQPQATMEDGLPVVRAQLEMPPRATSFAGRLRAVATNLINQLVRYPRVGLGAYELLREEWGAPDIVHVQALWPAAAIARGLKRRYGIPYIITEHSEEYLAHSERKLAKSPTIVRWLLRPLARDAARTIAVSRFLADRLVELGLATDPLVIPNVVPLAQPQPLPTAPPYTIAHVSVMGPAKNLSALLDAVAALRERRQDFRLRLVGDGECRAQLEQQSESLGLADVVEFAGRIDAAAIPDVLAQCAFTVVSSTHETFSVSAAESLMCGRPVLSTRCGGPEEFVTPEVGRLVDAGSAPALVEGLGWMLDNFTGFEPHALHEYAAARFAPDVVAERIVDVYREVLDG